MSLIETKETLQIVQGQHIPLKYGLTPEVDITAFTCKSVIRADDGTKQGELKLSKTLTNRTVDNFYYVDQYDPEDTVALEPGEYWLMGELDDPAGKQNAEIHTRLEVMQQGIV